MLVDGSGLRKGTAGSIEVTFTDAGRPKDLTGYTVAATARIGTGGTPFTPTVTAVVQTAGRYRVDFTSTNLNAVGDLFLEFTFTGTPTLNPNAKPVIIPVRDVYLMAT